VGAHGAGRWGLSPVVYACAGSRAENEVGRAAGGVAAGHWWREGRAKRTNEATDRFPSESFSHSTVAIPVILTQ
jgi:hypothetical protein